MTIRRTKRRRRCKLDDYLEYYLAFLAHGDSSLDLIPQALTHDYFKRELFLEERLEPVWNRHRDTIIGNHIAKHPGTRPWGWWQFETTEDRRLIGDPEDVGIKLGDSTGRTYPYRMHFGIPFRYVVDGYLVYSLGSHEEWDAIFESLFETERDYLTRLHLLTQEERVALETV